MSRQLVPAVGVPQALNPASQTAVGDGMDMADTELLRVAEWQ